MNNRTALPSNYRRRMSACAGLLTAILTFMAMPACADQQWEDTDRIERIAEDFVAAALRTAGREKAQLQAGRLDDRLRLPKCQAALEAFAMPGANLSRGGTVGVRCTEGSRWKIYVPVRVTMVTRVLVARHALARGTSVSAADVELVQRDVARLPAGYEADVSRLQGKQLRRRVMPGNVITPAMLVQSHAVRRGQRVTLLAGIDALSIRMAGTAMANGGIGERIAVKNLSSGRTVEGVVRTSETVEILQN